MEPFPSIKTTTIIKNKKKIEKERMERKNMRMLAMCRSVDFWCCQIETKKNYNKMVKNALKIWRKKVIYNFIVANCWRLIKHSLVGYYHDGVTKTLNAL